MSSPKEPGSAPTGEGSGPANGSGAGAPASGQDSGSRPAHTADTTELPPWQRGPAARARQEPQGPEAQRQDGPRTPQPGQPGQQGQPGQPGGLDARLNRFMAGGSAPAGRPETEQIPRKDPRPEPGPRGDRTDVVRPEGARPEGSRPEGRPEGRPEPGAAYASELPDLSGPRPPRPPQRPPVDRPADKPAAKGTAAPAGRLQVGTRQHKGPVRASMQIRRVDPWSTLKVSLLLSVVLFFVWMIAVAILYLVLGGMGVWSKLNSNVGDLLTSASGSSGGELVSSGTIFGGATLIGLVNIVLLTAGATIGAFIYNLTTDLVGGVEVTLADRD
ncbi:DUF3566 domain-containing protein [Mycolicibacterium parafortuitum]|uniref:DUF3566 domain-containing protein n=1 Tax=Mycolicibacterium parafortuitum TaxID=39692 RepID=A0A375YDM3_MYCPF|nr:DUF3566 domain-containing protein [Mycolicibacterium parafortuitum]ORB31182.1 hypothetical protein BST38_07765 [Mycolicibacterium parafortuitum]SRX79226.1 hypothetical protein [Sanguibacter keddieii DSM 10542] [Mycolicibacterium parafortuitum]